MQVENQTSPTPLRMVEFFGSHEDGPFVMVNLLKFKERAEYPDGTDHGLSGAAAYDLYGQAVTGIIERLGGRTIYSGAVTGLLLGEVGELWEKVALVEYPSLGALQGMVMSPEYQAIAVHRTAGLAGQLNIRTRADLGTGG